MVCAGCPCKKRPGKAVPGYIHYPLNQGTTVFLDIDFSYRTDVGVGCSLSRQPPLHSLTIPTRKIVGTVPWNCVSVEGEGEKRRGRIVGEGGQRENFP